MAFNLIVLEGNITNDLELKIGANKDYLKFGLAVQRGSSDKTDFFNCVAFGKTAETIEKYHEKGDSILIRGAVNIDKKDEKYYTNIVAHEFSFTRKNKAVIEDEDEDLL